MDAETMSNTLETLQRMSESPHDYDIGHWWNAVNLAIDEIEREIERLRAELDDQRKDTVCDEQRVADLMADVQRQGLEIERLRHALGLLTTLNPTMEIDVTDPVGMAQQIAAHVIDRLRDAAVIALTTERNLHEEIERLSLALANAKISFDAIDATLAERDAEIERLRGLLREGAEYPGSTQWLWRVREALGE